jgi:hypothetical protein
MATKISNFINLIAQGVKPNMFYVEIPFPAGTGVAATGSDTINLLCKSAALPAANLGVIEVPFRGRTIKIAGDRTFDTWSATFFNDKGMLTRSYFEKWLELMNTHDGNVAPLYVLNETTGYAKPIKVKQLQKDDKDGGSVLRTYTLHYAFPTSVSQIDLAYDSNDQIEEFTVEFQYSWWSAEKGTANDAGNGSDIKL